MRMGRVAIGMVAAVVAVLVLAQVFGPAIAARVITGRVGRYGTVRSVSVKAWPAIELLWRHADEVRVQAGDLRLSPEQAVGLLEEGSGTAKVQTHAEALEVDGVRVKNTTFVKNGSKLWARGTMSAADVARALPPGVRVALVSSGEGRVRVRASGGLFGVSASVEAVAYASNGKLVASPVAFGLSALKLTLVDNPKVYVEGVSARALGPGTGKGAGGEARYELSMWGRLR
jgi:hypothetical protein